MKKIYMYTDGACKGNPGPGGYGCILVFGEHEKVLSGGETETTNNRMELSAVIAGLSALKEPCEVEICSDSKYVVPAVSEGWLRSWIKNNWKKSDKKPVLNVDLWQKYIEVSSKHMPTFVWVRGHNGHPYNERCDALAVAEAEKFTK
jgi:ribonuclease HI